MEYHVVYSMGRDCASAMYLRDAGLRIRKIRRFIGRLLTIFVPIRKYRKMIRRAIDD